jgi:hypothetical protein
MVTLDTLGKGAKAPSHRMVSSAEGVASSVLRPNFDETVTFRALLEHAGVRTGLRA